jgi:hypothetical protein
METKNSYENSLASKVVLLKETLEFKHVIIFVMEVNNHWLYKVMCLIPKCGQ